tara:strand:+ start:717 stop:1790 length:1074 start_codon:yes stop_codon:yes gene_type:complete
MKTYIKFLITLFIKSFFKVFLIFFALILIINIFEQVEFLKQSNVSYLLPSFLSLLNTPSLIFEILPFIFLITTQLLFIRLMDNNELAVFKYTGLTNIRIVAIIGFFSFLFGLILIIFYYNFSAKLKNSYLEIKNSYSNDNKYLAVITENGLWIKDEINQGINIINASKVDDQFLLEVVITQFDLDYNYKKTIRASKVDISTNNWVIYSPLISEKNITNSYKQMIVVSNFNLKRINSLFSNLSSLTFLEIFALRNNYKSLNYSLIDIDSHLIKLFTYPLYLTIMTILSSIIMFNIGYQKNLMFNIVSGILISVLIYYVNFFFNILGTSEKIPVILSILLPLGILVLINSIFIVRLNEK